MNKRKILNDPVHGFITFRDENIFDLVEHHWFQRLRRIRQLGMTSYVYPGALHTRFQHAIGAMHLMNLAIDTLRSKEIDISKEESADLILPFCCMILAMVLFLMPSNIHWFQKYHMNRFQVCL